MKQLARLLNVSPEMLWIYPLNVRPDRSDYLKPKYGNLESIAVIRLVSEPYALPETIEDVEALLELLPDGFVKDYRFGLGLLWEYRAICEAFSGQDQVSRMIVHEGNQGNEATLDPPSFLLGRSRFHEICKEMLGKGLAEGRWQTFLTQNPFILSLAFAVPAMIVQDQAYAGGKRLSGLGGKVADFLCASASTGNLAIVEIKKPATDLLASAPYRGDDVFAASGELSGTIAQVLDQRVKLQRELPLLKEKSEPPDIHDYGIRCIVVAGRTPDDRARRKSLELLRNAMVGVTVLTFDELLTRLEEIHAALGPSEGASAGSVGEVPF